MKEPDQPDADWELRCAHLWADLADLGEEEFRSRIDQLGAELGADHPVALFESAAALDSTGHSGRAAPLYERALELGLGGERRRRAVIQMASSLRNLGAAGRSLALLEEEADRDSDGLDAAVALFRALALADLGREREGLAIALAALAPTLPRYNASAARYAADLLDDAAALPEPQSAP